MRLLIVSLISVFLGACLPVWAIWGITIGFTVIILALHIYFISAYADHEPLNNLAYYYGVLGLIFALFPMWTYYLIFR